jgi:S-methylmethionine-dependent homocysteine/selenocysteine methylase
MARWLERAPRVLDGGFGSELIRRNVTAARTLWGVGALLEAPDQVRLLHRDYAAAGAQVLTAVTFRVAPYSLRRHGLGERAAELARLAVGLARAGAADAGREVVVLAAMTTLEDCYRPDLVPDEATLRREHAATVAALAASGADGLLLETFNTAREAEIAASAAAGCGLPVIVCFACRGGRVLGGDDARAAAAAVSLPGVVAVGVNCTAVNEIGGVLARMREGTALQLVAYANNAWSRADSPWLAAAELAPAAFADAAAGWVGLGARLVGGCCGTRPAHIAALALQLQAEEHAPRRQGPS